MAQFRLKSLTDFASLSRRSFIGRSTASALSIGVLGRVSREPARVRGGRLPDLPEQLLAALGPAASVVTNEPTVPGTLRTARFSTRGREFTGADAQAVASYWSIASADHYPSLIL